MTYLAKAALAAALVACAPNHGPTHEGPTAAEDSGWTPSYADVPGLAQGLEPKAIGVTWEALEVVGSPEELDLVVELLCDVSAGQWCPAWYLTDALGPEAEGDVLVRTMSPEEQAAKWPQGQPDNMSVVGDAQTFGGGLIGLVRLWPAGADMADPCTTLAHELLHVAGLEHVREGAPGLMQPANAWWPSADEIDGLRALFAKARAEAPVL